MWRVALITLGGFAIPAIVGGLALGTTLGVPAQTRAQANPAPDDTRLIGGAHTAFWLPVGGTPPFPLVLFSHGAGGCRNQSGYLMRAMAQAGMVVAASDHEDQRCGQMPDATALQAELLRPETWTDATFAGRRDQLRQLRADLLADATLGRQIDPLRLALVGHSLGGYGVLGLAGARSGRRLDGLVAVVALAPYLAAYQFGGTPAAITVPVLIEAGKFDPATASLPSFFAKLTAPACQQVFTAAGHFAWVDSSDLPAHWAQPQFQAATSGAAVAFLVDAFAGGTPAAPAPSTPSADVSCK